MLFVKNHIPCLWDLSNTFSNRFIDFYSCEGFHISERMKHKASHRSCQKIALTSETFAQIFLYLTPKQYKWTWLAYYVEEKQHIIKVCSSENKHTNKTAPTSDPAEMWQQHRHLEVKVKLTWPLKVWTFTNLVRRLFPNIFWFLVYILPRMEVQTSPKAGKAKQNANSKPYAVFGILH